jgi:hypothetical protein
MAPHHAARKLFALAMAQQRNHIAAHESGQILNHRCGVEQRQLRSVDTFVGFCGTLRYFQVGTSGPYSGPRHQVGAKFETDTCPGARERAACANALVNIVIMPPGTSTPCNPTFSHPAGQCKSAAH